ncbi:histidine phosphotransferase family protein [Litoreibacter arenae]|uniref:Signal transduction histidine kinase n=1 Tax=Litoreibacter arenae DSM 19593 TaxID=1123360 RepID=S9RYK6_9RHOB|nr:histidine phosphotransferase family protein [Litoreibacter arenae]EPX79049.1 Signal transduction histidine kinase [Litoreibacter arenae DSM 19593]
MSDKALSDVDDAIDLKDTASLLASRICHDLISPIGAISNGMELLVMSGLPPSPELTLIEESIANANARVRLFRLAFGVASAGQRMARGDIVKLLGDCYASGRIQVMWEPTSDVSRQEAKIALLGVLCLETALPAGGKIVLRCDRGSWQMQAYGEKIRVEPEVWSVLMPKATKAGDLSAAQVQFILLRDALAQLGATAQAGHSDSAVSLRYDV